MAQNDPKMAQNLGDKISKKVTKKVPKCPKKSKSTLKMTQICQNALGCQKPLNKRTYPWRLGGVASPHKKARLRFPLTPGPKSHFRQKKPFIYPAKNGPNGPIVVIMAKFAPKICENNRGAGGNPNKS